MQVQPADNTIRIKIRPAVAMADIFDPVEIKMADERLAAATLWLTRNESFYSTLWLNLMPTLFEGTFGVTNHRFFYDPRYTLTNTAYELRFKLMHEALHVAMKHYDPRRLAKYSHRIRNHAYDYCINWTIVEAGRIKMEETGYDDPSYHMPEDGLYNEAFGGMLPEEIAELLWQEEQKQGKSKPEDSEGDGDGSGKGTGEWGEVFEAEGEGGRQLTDKEMDAINADTERKVIQAENVAKSRGQMPMNVSSMLDEIRDPTPEWQDQFVDMVRDVIPTDLSYAKPNRLRMDDEIIWPSIEKEGLGHVLFMVDESSSVSDAEEAQFFADIDFIFEDMNAERITVIRFNAIAKEPVTYEPGDTFPHTRGHGGTRFISAFDKAKETGIEDECDVCVFFTDGGDNTFPDEEPPYPVIWAVTGAWWGGDPPFGRTLAVKFKD